MLNRATFLCVRAFLYERERERCINMRERCLVQRCDFRADLNVLRDELVCSSDGRVFQRIIERGRKLERDECFLTRGTG